MSSILACMQQICSSMQQQWFFGVYWKIMVLFCNKVTQMKIFSPYKAIFNEKNNTLHFGPVCSKYAAVCSNRDFFLMSTPSKFFQHTKLALFPNFDALFRKITSRYILGTHSLDYKGLSPLCAWTKEDLVSLGVFGPVFWA